MRRMYARKTDALLTVLATYLVLQAAATAQAVITKKPMLQDVRTDSMALLWETDTNPTLNWVEWGTNSINENSTENVTTIQIDASHYVHKAVMTGLDPETSYIYKVRSDTAYSSSYSFRTAPNSDTPFTMAWFGDNQYGDTRFRQHIPHIADKNPDLLCSVGDVVNDGNVIDQWGQQWFSPLEIDDLAQTTPVIFARGNHDGEYSTAYDYSTLPGNESYYAFTYGNSRFVFLNTNTYDSAQTQWLEQELNSPESKSAQFRVVAFHKSPYTDLWNHPFFYNGDSFARGNWVPLFEEYGVDIVLSGHVHAYERGVRNGVTYMIVGGAGGFLDTFTPILPWGFFDTLMSVYHYMVMEVDGPVMSFQVYDLDDNLIDTYTLNSTTLVPGDTNGDGKVDIIDLGTLAGNYGVTENAIWAMGDFNYDGAVDVLDLGALAGNYGVGTGGLNYAVDAAGLALVPEPITMLTFGLGGLAVMTAGRRRLSV